MIGRLRRWFALRSGQDAARAPETDGRDRDLLDRFARCRAEVLERVREANHTTEVETLEVGDHLRAIVAAAEERMERMRSAVDRLEGGGGDNIVSEAMRGQSESTTTFVGGLLAMLRDQSDVAARATAQSDDIAAIARSISDVARAARMLSLNTMVEAERLGEGSSFAVIASEMKRLSDSVQLANDRVRKLALGLSQEIAAITDRSRSMVENAESFSTTHSDQLRRMGEVNEHLRNALEDVTSSGDAEDARLVRGLHEALHHLQFQDPVAQRLLRIDRLLTDLHTEVAERCGVELSAEDVAVAHVEIGGGVDVEGAEAGEVVFF